MSDSPSFDQLEVQNLASHSSPHQGHSGQNQGQAGPHQVHGFKLVGFSQNHLMNDSAPPLCTDDEVFFWSKVSIRNYIKYYYKVAIRNSQLH